MSSDLEYSIKKYTIDNYGDLIVPDKPSFDKKTKTWSTQLRSTYPRIIEDEESKEIVVKFLNLMDLGTITMNEEFQVIKATTSDNCEDQLLLRLDLWKKMSETIVVTASSNVFAEIAEGIHVLYPLVLILDKITSLKDSDNFKILESDVDEQRRPERIRQYLDLLEELDIVRKVNDGYVYGNVYVGILEKLKMNSKKFKTTLLSYVIKHKYSTLRQVFDIRQLEPFVHLANAYYWPSLDAEKLVHMSRAHLYQRYQDYYDKITTWDFESRVSELTDHGALQLEHGYLIGNKDRFEEMLELKHKVQLNP